MTRILGLLVATVTRAGATGLIGLRSVLNAEPDGYNLVLTTQSRNLTVCGFET